MSELAFGLVYYLVFVLSTSLHEAAHAWAALRGGDSTAYAGGQVTLDPIPHIRREPFGMVALPLISVVLFGWPIGYASAPYDAEWAARFPRRAAWMSFAGPAANFLLVLLAGALIQLGLFAGVFSPPDWINFADVTSAAEGAGALWEPIAYLLGSFFAMKLLLCIFNMIPVPPLDGSGVIMLWLPERVAKKYQQLLWDHPELGWIGIPLACWLLDPLFDPLFTFALNVLYFFSGIEYS